MLKIAFCDDNEYFCAELKNLCVSFLGNSKDYEFLIFHSGSKLLAYKQKIDIVFLDINMPGKDGIKIAEEFNKRKQNTRIIMVTNHTETAIILDALNKAHVFGFLCKPIKIKDFEKSLLEATRDLKSNAKITVECTHPNSKTDIIVFEKDIIYIESIGDFTVIYTTNQGLIECRKTLKQWMNELNELDFFQIHRAYIVSYAHIASKSKTFVMTTNGNEIPIAKRKAKQFEDNLGKYIKSGGP